VLELLNARAAESESATVLAGAEMTHG
jgi:hypothetical protein